MLTTTITLTGNPKLIVEMLNMYAAARMELLGKIATLGDTNYLKFTASNGVKVEARNDKI